MWGALAPETLSSRLLSENVKIGIRMVLYGCETWSVTLREEKRVLRRIFGPKRGEVTGGWREKSFITCTLLQVLLE
jgi:hypothetical protein